MWSSPHFDTAPFLFFIAIHKWECQWFHGKSALQEISKVSKEPSALKTLATNWTNQCTTTLKRTLRGSVECTESLSSLIIPSLQSATIYKMRVAATRPKLYKIALIRSAVKLPFLVSQQGSVDCLIQAFQGHLSTGYWLIFFSQHFIIFSCSAPARKDKYQLSAKKEP